MLRKSMLMTLAVCALTGQTAIAQTNLGLKGVGGAVSIVSPEDMDATFGFGVMVDHGTIVPNLALESRLDYWSKSEDVFGGEVSARDIAVGARCKYLFNLASPRIQPFAGAGLGLHFLKAEVDVAPLPGFPNSGMSIEDTSTELGLDLGGGMAAGLSPRTSLLAEAWYGIVSDMSQLSFRVGLAYAFGGQPLHAKAEVHRAEPGPKKAKPAKQAKPEPAGKR